MKKYVFTLIVTIIAGFCIFSPIAMIEASKSALSLWATIIIPSLLPFMIIADLIQKTALPYILGKILNPIMKPIFNLPGISSIAIFLGMTGGYPIGAKITKDMANENLMSKDNANHLITFVNNSGPLFMLGAVGVGIYKSTYVGSLLLISHYLSALTVGMLLHIFQKKVNLKDSKQTIKFQVVKLSELGSTLSNSIRKSIDIILVIGGFIILFSIISAILEQTGILTLFAKILFPMFNIEMSKSIITGILEITTGINKTAMINIPLQQKIIITSILVGFGGLSIHFQTLSILAGSAIKFKNYLIGKSLHGILSGLISYLLINFTAFSTLIPFNVSASVNNYSKDFSKILNTISAFLIFSALLKIFQILIRSKPIS